MSETVHAHVFPSSGGFLLARTLDVCLYPQRHAAATEPTIQAPL